MHPSAEPPPRRDKLPSLIDDEPVSVGRVTGAGWRPTTVSTTMKGLGPLAAQSDVATTEPKPGLSAPAYFRLAEAAFQREDLAVAEDHARKAVERDPAHLDAAIFLAWIRGLGTAANAAEDSVRALSQMLLDDPNNEKALLYRAKLLARVNRWSEALADLEELLSANPHHAEVQATIAAFRAKAAAK